MGFGLSFGKKKQSSTTQSTLTKNETTNQQQTSDKASTSTQTGTTAQQGSATGQSSTTQQDLQQQQSVKGSSGQQTTQLFSDQALGGLEAAVQSLFGGVDRSANVTGRAIDALQGFDAEGYVDSSVRAASASEQSGLDQIFGGISDKIGSSLGNNSMAALLAARAQGDSAARIEGVRAEATGRAQEINRSNQLGAVQAAQAENAALNEFLATLKGGTGVTSTTGTETAQGTTSGSQTGTTNTAEQNQQTAQTSSVTQLQELLSQLLTGTTATVGTEDSKTKGKTSGGGFSLGI